MQRFAAPIARPLQARPPCDVRGRSSPARPRLGLVRSRWGRRWCMRSRRTWSVTVAMVMGALVARGGAGAAWADDPVSFGSSPVVDQAGVLGDRQGEVENALDDI